MSNKRARSAVEGGNPPTCWTSLFVYAQRGRQSDVPAVFPAVAVAVRRDQRPYLPVGRCSLGADLLVLQAGAGLSVAGVLRQSFQNLGHGAVFCSPAGGDAEGRTGNHADHLHPPQGHRAQAGVVPHPAEDRPPQGDAGRLDHAHRGDNHRAGRGRPDAGAHTGHAAGRGD